MEEEIDSSQPDFWTERYASGETPWDFHGIPTNLDAFLRRTPSHSRVLIPGCGGDHNAIRAFCNAGHEVIAIDFCPVAVEQAKEALGELRDKIILGDFFGHNLGSTHFDIVYERTFLCSLPPVLWGDYAGRVAQLLRPGGTLAGFFFYGDEPEPPPHPLSEVRAAELLNRRFELVRSEPVPDSLPIFAGMEKWQEWQTLGAPDLMSASQQK